jgi:hypothetical protein
MGAESLVDAIQSLTPVEQESVREFLEFLKAKARPRSPFLSAVEEFSTSIPNCYATWRSDDLSNG